MGRTELADPALAATQRPGTGRAVARFDFRRTDLFGRDAVRGLTAAHELFTRRVASGLGSALRALVRLDAIGVDQVPYDAYIRSMPTPNVLSLVSVPPLPGSVVLELGSQLALAMVDRMLGGRASQASMPGPVRRPTDLETALLTDLVRHVSSALADTLAVVPGCEPALEGIEYNPQLVQVAAPSDMVVVLSYRLVVSQGVDVEGLLSMCYPAATITALLDHLHVQRHGGADADSGPRRNEGVAEQLADVPVTLTVGVGESSVGAADLAALREGDVLRLDQRVGAPVRASVAGAPVLEGHIGRRGRRLAFQVGRWVPSTPPRPPDPQPHPAVPDRSST